MKKEEKTSIPGFSDEKIEELRAYSEAAAAAITKDLINNISEYCIQFAQAISPSIDEKLKYKEVALHIFSATFISEMARMLMGELCALQVTMGRAKNEKEVKKIVDFVKDGIIKSLDANNFKIVTNPKSAERSVH